MPDAEPAPTFVVVDSPKDPSAKDENDDGPFAAAFGLAILGNGKGFGGGANNSEAFSL